MAQVLWQAKFVRRFMNAKAIEDAEGRGLRRPLGEVDRASIPFAGDKNPLVFPDAKEWDKLSKSRQKILAERQRQRSERDIEIEKKLRTPVSLQFTNAPLSKVLEYLAKLADVNLHLDPQGLAEEGVTSDTPVTIELRNEIMLKSALNLILEPLHLSYVVKDEVLKITSEQMRDGQVYTRDLQRGRPGHSDSQLRAEPAMGLAGAYQGAMANVGFGGGTHAPSARRRPRRWRWWPAATARAAARCSIRACWPKWARRPHAGPVRPEERAGRAAGRADSAAAPRPTSTA